VVVRSTSKPQDTNNKGKLGYSMNWRNGDIEELRMDFSKEMTKIWKGT
jgi:hypothetical protein